MSDKIAMKITGLRPGVLRQWENIPVDYYNLKSMFMFFELLYVLLDDGTYIDMNAYRANYNDSTLKLQAFISSIDSIITIPVSAVSKYLHRSRCTHYRKQGFVCENPSGSQDALLTYEYIVGYSTDWLKANTGIYLVNGLAHLAVPQPDSYAIRVIDAYKTIGISRFNQIQVLGLPGKVSFTQSSFTQINNSKFTAPTGVPANQFIFVIAGYICVIDNVSLVKDGDSVTINTRSLNLAKKLYEAKHLIDLSSLSIDWNNLSDNYAFTDAELNEILSLPQSFVCTLNSPVILRQIQVKPLDKHTLVEFFTDAQGLILQTGPGRISNFHQIGTVLCTQEEELYKRAYKTVDNGITITNPRHYMPSTLGEFISLSN